MKNLLLTLLLFWSSSPSQAQITAQPPKVMTPAQAGLPSRFEIPPFTRLRVKVANPPKEPLPGSPEAASPGEPVFVEAAFTKDASNLEVIFKWSGNRFTKAYQIQSLTLYQNSLNDPDSIDIQDGSSGLTFYFNQFAAFQGRNFGAFPGLYFYSPTSQVTEEQEGGRFVYRITQSNVAQGPKGEAIQTDVSKTAIDQRSMVIIDQKTHLPLRMTDRGVIYLFSYESVKNFQVRPEGKYAELTARLLKPPE